MAPNIKMTKEQYLQLAKIVYRESGVVLNEKKYHFLEAMLSKRVRLSGVSSVSDYIELILSNPGEFDRFIDATTTNHTFFFRENKHCEFIVNTIPNDRPLKIWSAASSSGEEAFSIAVQLIDRAYDFSIFASDVSDSMLEIAKKAIYPTERIREVPVKMLHTYFQKGKNAQKGFVRLKPGVRRYVTFAKHNLLSRSSKKNYDIIFCRNVMIYFDVVTRKKVVEHLLNALKPDGYLFIGLSEALRGFDHDMVQIFPGGYRKK